MRPRLRLTTTLLILLAFLQGSVSCTMGRPAAPAPPKPVAEATPTESPTAAEPPTPVPPDPFPLISRDSLLTSLGELTAIRADGGWRSPGTQGEGEGLDYVTNWLKALPYLQTLGLELERQQFRVFLSTELWEARLQLTVGGKEFDVPAGGLFGQRDDLTAALAFDSDGKVNDADRNPLVAKGPVLLVRSAEDLKGVQPDDVRGKVVLLDYAAVDRSLMEWEEAGIVAWLLLEAKPAGMVLITQDSDKKGESHGSFVGYSSMLAFVKESSRPPIIYARLEDLAPAGITSWEDLARVKSARVTWDADVFSPATSGNLVARIPGVDPSRAVILGAHIDSPNCPGALDDGSGSVVLLEVARTLDAAGRQPPVDLYLVWFGSEELMLYGSGHFAATHQDLLDRTLAMLQIDCLSRPLEGIPPQLSLVTWSYGRLGDARLAWPDYLVQAAAAHGVQVKAENIYETESDNSSFGGFGVPNADLSYINHAAMKEPSVHYSGHLHDPYDTIEQAREVAEPLEQMARVALAAALDVAQAPDLRVARPADRRVVFVASHTEAVHMTPAALIELGLTLTWEGLDVDMVPYGQAVTPADLEGASLVVALPVLDYPSTDGDLSLYDEAWTKEEIAALEGYVAGGGLLVLANSAHRLQAGNYAMDDNEDVLDANALAGRFGVAFQKGTLPGTRALTEGGGPLLLGVGSLQLVEDNGVPFTIKQGKVLARAGTKLALALVDYGEAGGQVLVVADLGMLGSDEEKPANLPFWRNLASYAHGR